MLHGRDQRKNLRQGSHILDGDFSFYLGAARNCIGFNVEQARNAIIIDQMAYTLNTLKKFGMEDSKPVANPCNTSVKLSIRSLECEEELTGRVPYQEAVGSLLYLAQCSRPNEIRRQSLQSETHHQPLEQGSM